MLIRIVDALERAKEAGGKDNHGISLTAHIEPLWLGWILRPFYPLVGIRLEVDYGEIEDKKLVQRGESTWSANPDSKIV